MNTTSDIITWTAPPPPSGHDGKRRPGRRGKFVAALKSRPGEWGMYPVPQASPSAGRELRKAYGPLETKTRRRDDGRYDLYARWMGDQ